MEVSGRNKVGVRGKENGGGISNAGWGIIMSSGVNTIALEIEGES